MANEDFGPGFGDFQEILELGFGVHGGNDALNHFLPVDLAAVGVLAPHQHGEHAVLGAQLFRLAADADRAASGLIQHAGHCAQHEIVRAEDYGRRFFHFALGNFIALHHGPVQLNHCSPPPQLVSTAREISIFSPTISSAA